MIRHFAKKLENRLFEDQNFKLLTGFQQKMWETKLTY